MTSRISASLIVAACAISLDIGLGIGLLSGTALSNENELDFLEDVRPILVEHCFRCHSSQNQEGGLRLDNRESIMGTADSGEAIVRSEHPGQSLLISRLTDPDAGDLMPLDGSRLSESEIDLLRRWIGLGAPMEDLDEHEHWAYLPLERPVIPEVVSQSDAEATSPTSPVDQFIARKLQHRRLTFNPPVARARWIRRASLALIGLPPSVEQVQEFLADNSANAYEKVVDRLLQSQRFGERWASPWLDLARYADSNGFQADQLRDNWAYRDWVIKALNSDMPFDEFVIEQLAGDLLPEATLEQRIATGFHRMTTCNVEAGVDPEANRVNQIFDRVNTTATVFMGTTLECAQCHDHKYDPFTQRDYYGLFAYFNNTPLEVENTSGVTWDFFGPTMDLPLSEMQDRSRVEIQQRIDSCRGQIENKKVQLEPGFLRWLADLRKFDSENVWQTMAPVEFASTGEEDYTVQSDGAVLLSGAVPDKAVYKLVFEFSEDDFAAGQPITAIRVEALTDDAIPGTGPGRGEAARPNFILSEISCELVPREGERHNAKFSRATADFSQKRWNVEQAIDGDTKTGWAISPQFGKSHWAVFELADPQPAQNCRLVIRLTQNYGRGRVIGKPRLSFSTTLPSLIHATKETVQLAKRKKPNAQQLEKLFSEYAKSNSELQRLEGEVAQLEKDLAELQPDTTLVMTELESPRQTFVFSRGDYEQPGTQVEAAVPELFELPEDISRSGDRLELAKWLTSRDNPLLARVTVNRWWAELFGVGLVGTAEDFGTQAEFPSHPQLLDWLAVELIESGWSMKHVMRCMVLSRTFGQEATGSQGQFEQDPRNRLLSRGPRVRLTAELVRDNALAISGLLSDKMYGPPVMPYQPEKVWRSVGRNQPTWKAAANGDRFRRGVYVIWKRAAPYPSFINFDSPDRASCTVTRSRSNTPLQALTLLNDPAYAEIALAFADRILVESGSGSDLARLQFAFQLALAREPTTFELSVLQQLLDEERRHNSPQVTKDRTTPQTIALRLQSQDKRELAVWFAVANAILNLDETICP